MKRHLAKAVMLGGIAILGTLAVVGPRRTPSEQPELPGPEPARISVATPPPSPRPPPPRPPEPPPPAVVEAPVLLAQTAAEWRARVRGDSESRTRFAGLLSDPAMAPEIAEVMALVLGSLGERAALLKVLEQGSAAPREALIYAAGFDSAGPEAEIFRRPEGPRVVTTPAGLRIRLVARVEDAGLRKKVLALLGDASTPVREAAYVLLAGSLDDLAGITAEARKVLLEKAASPEGAALRPPLAKLLAPPTPAEEEILWKLVRSRDDAVSAWARSVLQQPKK